MKIKRVYKPMLDPPFRGRTWYEMSEEDFEKLKAILTDEQKEQLGGFEEESSHRGYCGPM